MQSRATSGGDGGGNEMPFSMVPYFDLLNHSADWNCMQSFEDASYVVRATRVIREGEQCYISYGRGERSWFLSALPSGHSLARLLGVRLANSSLLRKYGFVTDGNLSERVAIDER